MIFKGSTIQCNIESNQTAKLVFNNEASGSNVFNQATLAELKECLAALTSQNNVKGLIVTSSLSHFIFGADITEFLTHFKKDVSEMIKWLKEINDVFNSFEDLPYPTVCAINGFALGGGFEMALTTDYRIALEAAKVGLPETKLGIMPGWGGTVRLSRLAGVDNAIEWITSGKQYKAYDAFKIGAVDAVVTEPDNLINAANKLLERAIHNELDWKAQRTKKKSAVKLNDIEAAMSIETAKGFVFSIAGKNYPAPMLAIETIQKGLKLGRDEALVTEGQNFAKLTKTPQASSLVSVFLGDQYLKKVSKKITKELDKVKQAAVLGAGIMGGGIAYQSASKGTPIIMKDIRPEALELGMGEATKLLNKLVERNKISTTNMAKTISMITPSLSYANFESVDCVVEAVVENKKIKKAVLSETEGLIGKDAILCSNTSTISITELATDLKRPENFCGMHFFNPVHRMPLVEVIRGAKTSEETIAKTVQYALQMGKTPIVVNDCAGFLVNRILFPYFFGFNGLIQDGVDFKRIDKIMERFGWPMGPAYLLDVVGIDTCVHAAQIMADAFPDRMKYTGENVFDVMYKQKRFGQKNNLGFYEYTLDRKGKPKKNLNPEVYSLIKPFVTSQKDVSDDEIVERMMLPMIIEAARCLEENIVNTPQEVDMGLLLGLGFPPFRAGALKYADDMGLDTLNELSKKYQNLGNAYQLTDKMAQMAKSSAKFYQMGE